MKKAYQILGLSGALLWCATILLRSLNIWLPEILAFLIGVMPNVGAVWLCASIGVTFYPYFFHREITRTGRYAMVIGILGVMLLSELVHYAFLGAGFDLFDMGASVIAAIPLLIMNALM